MSGAYYSYCNPYFASLASDKSYLSIDTNPLDIDDYSDDDAIQAILNVNEALDIPDSVARKLSSTRALDGIQSQECGNVEVSWSYHPDNGLEVIYTRVD